MKRNGFLGLALVMVLAVALIGAPPAMADEGKIHLKFSTWHTPVSREVKTVWTPMLEKMKEQSKGRITYTLYAGGALGKGPEHFDIVKNGLSDMGYFTATWTPGRFPVSDVLSLATKTEGKDVSTDIGNELFEQCKTMQDEFKGVKMLELNGCISSYLWTKKPVKTLADCKGLKLRSPGGHQTNYIKALGAEPVFMPLGDVYLALETGTIDGLVTCPPLVLAFKLYEVAKYGAIATFGCVTEGVVMNQKSWDKTPKDLQKIIEDVARNPYKITGGLTNKVYGKMMEEITSHQVNLYTLPAEEQALWSARFAEETKKWVADLEKKGKPAKEVVMKYSKILDKHNSVCEAIPPEWK